VIGSVLAALILIGGMFDIVHAVRKKGKAKS